MTKTKGSDYRLSPLSNGERKRREAAKHNMGYMESQAYAQDRHEDPAKYQIFGTNKARRDRKRKMVGLIGAITAMGFHMDYPD